MKFQKKKHNDWWYLDEMDVNDTKSSQAHRFSH